MDWTATTSDGRPVYFGTRREVVINRLAGRGVAAAIDRAMDAGSWAVVPYGKLGHDLIRLLYDRGLGWVDGRLGLWADAAVVGPDGGAVPLADHGLFVPGVRRDEACRIAHGSGAASALYGEGGRYTCIDTADRPGGRDCGWRDVRPDFASLAGSATHPPKTDAEQHRWSIAPPRRRVGRHLEYLFNPGPDGLYPPAPTHYFYKFETDQKHRDSDGLVPWAGRLPDRPTQLAIWLPLSSPT